MWIYERQGYNNESYRIPLQVFGGRVYGVPNFMLISCRYIQNAEVMYIWDVLKIFVQIH